MCLGKLCVKLAGKQSFPSTKNGLQGLRLQLLTGWRYDLWKQAAQALLLKRRCGKGAGDWKDGGLHTNNESTMLPTVEWKHQRKHRVFFAGTISTFAERYTILEGWSFWKAWPRSTPIAHHPNSWLAVFVRPMSMLPDCWNSKTVD